MMSRLGSTRFLRSLLKLYDSCNLQVQSLCTFFVLAPPTVRLSDSIRYFTNLVFLLVYLISSLF